MSSLGQSVYDDPAGVESITLREADDEVHRDIGPWVVRNRQWHESSVGGVSSGLDPATGVAVASAKTKFQLQPVLAIVIPQLCILRIVSESRPYQVNLCISHPFIMEWTV